MPNKQTNASGEIDPMCGYAKNAVCASKQQYQRWESPDELIGLLDEIEFPSVNIETGWLLCMVTGDHARWELSSSSNLSTCQTETAQRWLRRREEARIDLGLATDAH